MDLVLLEAIEKWKLFLETADKSVYCDDAADYHATRAERIAKLNLYLDTFEPLFLFCGMWNKGTRVKEDDVKAPHRFLQPVTILVQHNINLLEKKLRNFQDPTK